MRVQSILMFATCALCISSARAQGASLLGCLDCFNFVAPSVFSAEAIMPSEVGLIVYDSTRGGFRGYNDSGRWLKLSNEREMRTVAATSSVLSTDDVVLANAGAGAMTVTLPAASSVPGKEVSIKKMDASANLVTIDANLSETIDGDLTRFLSTQNESLRILSNGVNWIVTDRTLRAPTVQKFTSGSGIYARPDGVAYLRIRMVGGGGGGAGSGTSVVGTGGNGENTTFGASLLIANGGGGSSATQANGGAVGVNAPALNLNSVAGASGNGAISISSGFPNGTPGASSPFGGAGAGGAANGSGATASTNSGSGGGSAGGPNPGSVGASGAAGGYVEAIIPAPAATYAYTVGAPGAGGPARDGGYPGGSGGSGYIEVTEYYR